MECAEVVRYHITGNAVTERGYAAVVADGWDMEWRSDGSSHSSTGRELVVLSRRRGDWRIVWRTQLPG